jgi:cytosine/uracil/thiamine/allantoin permease
VICRSLLHQYYPAQYWTFYLFLLISRFVVRGCVCACPQISTLEKNYMQPDSNQLWNEDLAPTSEAQRTWRWYHFAALWVGMVMCIPAYTLSASLIEGGMSGYQAVWTVFLANAIVLVPMF